MDNDNSRAVMPARGAAVMVVGVAIGLSLVLAGCGSDNDSSAGNDSEATAPQAESDRMADAATIRERIIGNTVTGTMSPESAYTEFYAPDGSIFGVSYEARWSIRNDEMCLAYDESPQSDCYGVKINGKTVEWHRQGEVQGTGTIVAGNPNNF